MLPDRHASRCVRTGLLTILGVIFCSYADLAIAVTITFNSVPSNAQVCFKKRGRPECIGKTPLQHNIDFAGEHDSKPYIFKRIGYQTKTRLITAKDRNVLIKLKRRQIFVDPEKHKSQILVNLQKQVNKILSTMIYGQKSPVAGLDTELVGRIGLETFRSDTILKAGVLLTNSQKRRQLGSVRRKHESNERNRELARVALSGEAMTIIRSLTNALRGIPEIKRITLTIDYTKSSAALVDESVHYYRTFVTQQYDRAGPSGYIEHVTTYMTVREKEEVLKVEDSLDIRTLLVSVPLDKLSRLGAGADNIKSVLAISEIFSNDNRHKSFKLVTMKN